jgi:hypothetical protein
MGWKSTSGIIVAGGTLLASVVIPNFIKARTTPCTNACVANLKQIQGAIEMYALESMLKPTDRVTINDISGGEEKAVRPLINAGLTCPAGGTYSVTTVGEPPRCSVPGHTL